MRRVKWKWRDTSVLFEVDLEDHEWDWFKAERDAVVAMPEGPERTAKLNEVCTFMELKQAFPGGHMLSDAEMEALGLDAGEAEPAPPPITEEARTEALASLQAMRDRGYKVPDAAFKAVTEGQTSLLATQTPTRLPYKDQDEPEPAPLATEAHARTTDRWTSHAAARSITVEQLRATQAAVLDCFKRTGAMHHEELVNVYEGARADFGWPPQSVSGLRTRTSELVEAGYIRDTGRTVRLASGRASTVWEAQ